LLVIPAVAAKLAIVLAIPQTLLEVIHVWQSIVLADWRRVPEPLVVSLLVVTEVVRVIWLLMIGPVATTLTVVLSIS
jgi:hypothetical protein